MEDSQQRETDATTELYDVAAEIGQSALSVILSDNVLEHIPVLKIGIAAVKMVRSVRDQILINKLLIFVEGPLSAVSLAGRREMVEKLNSDPEFRQDVGEHLIELLDRIDGRRKPAMLSAVFAALAENRISRSMFSRLNLAIERLPSIDIDNLRRVSTESFEQPVLAGDVDSELEPEGSQALVSANLMIVGSGFGGSTYKLSKTGMAFLELALDKVVPVHP